MPIYNIKISNSNRNDLLTYIRQERLKNNHYKVIDVGGSVGGWSSNHIDAIVDFNDPPNTTIPHFKCDITHPDSWNNILQYVQQHGKFDFCICTHTLEDIMNPCYVSEQLSKIAKEGYIAFPSKYRELSRFEMGTTGYRGHIHHRWIFDIINNVCVAYPKVNFIENPIFDQIADMNDLKSDLSFYWNQTIEMKYLNNNYLGPDVQSVINYYLELLVEKPTICVGFFVAQFSERGTEVATYDYAKYNEELLQNKSYIICFSEQAKRKHEISLDRHSFEKFRSRFQIIEIDSMEEMTKVIKDLNLSFFYTLTGGGGNDYFQFENKQIWNNCKTIKHCVFDTRHPIGDVCASISNYLNIKYNTRGVVVPHMVDLPDNNENFREILHIPTDAIVFGRYGGNLEFNIQMTHEAIVEFVNSHDNVYFLFMNTNPFYHHPRIYYIEGTTDSLLKVKFINTCDAMIHARSMGETFGLAIAEFSSKNKPVITCPCGDLEHILLLGKSAIYYKSKQELLTIFTNIQSIINSKSDWNAYREYTPEKVMKKFAQLLLTI